jgi:hypothetical protein
MLVSLLFYQEALLNNKFLLRHLVIMRGISSSLGFVMQHSLICVHQYALDLMHALFHISEYFHTLESFSVFFHEEHQVF